MRFFRRDNPTPEVDEFGDPRGEGEPLSPKMRALLMSPSDWTSYTQAENEVVDWYQETQTGKHLSDEDEMLDPEETA